ncbi:hypothetical protein EYF80_013738 [Liparis tanakae]|uniref:Uncharacterized protein n=1 Tax=Liparis tanakae TaxID=230148 RepID=A0A4Z2IEH9_9TELE|nr:hypothetical protein EYF80_013738 [Liparis tanakae]
MNPLWASLPAEPDGGGAPAFCHSVASMAMRLTKASSTHIRMFSGLMSEAGGWQRLKRNNDFTCSSGGWAESAASSEGANAELNHHVLVGVAGVALSHLEHKRTQR